MFRKFYFPVIILILGVGIFLSPTFEEIATGIAILLFGMIMLEKGFNSFVQGPLQVFLRKATDKLYKSLGVGFLVTALLQSSSLISVITISFISVGIIDLYAGIGVIFGANIGTTATAWLVTFFGLKIKVSTLAMPMIVFGTFFVFQNSKSIKGLGNILIGLGFFFLGIHFMKEGFDIYKDSINLGEYAIEGILGLVVYTIIGVLITMILQSSSATMALILTALAAGQISYQNSLALAIGANVGTTITAILGSIGSNTAGKRLAGAHFVFNIITGIIALAFINQLSLVVDYFSDWIGISSNDFTLKLSIFHTIFNVLGVLVMLPFIKLLIKFLTKYIKEKDVEDKGVEYPVYLNNQTLNFAQTAYKSLLDESKRLFNGATFEVVTHGLNLHREDILSNNKLKSIIDKSRKELEIDIDDVYYQKVKIIYSKIIEFATLAQSKFNLAKGGIDAFSKIKLANRNMVEIIKDMKGLRKNVTHFMLSDNAEIRHEYDRLRKKITKVLRTINTVKTSDDPEQYIVKLEQLKNKALQSDVLFDGTIDKLIREHKISSEMASSLIYDSDKVADISKKLLETAELLYFEKDTLDILEPIDNIDYNK